MQLSPLRSVPVRRCGRFASPAAVSLLSQEQSKSEKANSGDDPEFRARFTGNKGLWEP